RTPAEPGAGPLRGRGAGGTVVLAGVTARGAEVTVVRGAAGAYAPVGALASHAEEPVVAPRPRLLTLGERELRGALYLPSWHREGAGKLPVLLDPYGGPGLQLVGRDRGWPACVSQWFAEQGFAVLVVDGRGTP